MKLPFLPFHESSSFFDFVHETTQADGRGKAGVGIPGAAMPGSGARVPDSVGNEGLTGGGLSVPMATTVLALRFDGGVLIAGDRRATEGFQIADRRIQKVFAIDTHSAMAIAGAAGPCMEMAKLLQTELEHYEKIEGEELSCEGKANKLGQMVKANLPMVFQGLVVMPIFSGYDLARKEGRIFKYDLTGGRYEELDYYAIGSGGKDARSTMREHYQRGLSSEQALSLALLSLYNAAEDDVGTGGPDVVRGIYPTAKIITEAGIAAVEGSRIKRLYADMIAVRTRSDE
ncbi:MAG: proteasome subunit beta [Nitrospiraceae bacterium]